MLLINYYFIDFDLNLSHNISIILKIFSPFINHISNQNCKNPSIENHFIHIISFCFSLFIVYHIPKPFGNQTHQSIFSSKLFKGRETSFI